MPTPLQDIEMTRRWAPSGAGQSGTISWAVSPDDYAYRRGEGLRVRVALRRAGARYEHVATFPSSELDRLLVWGADRVEVQAYLRGVLRRAADEAVDLLTLGRLPRTG